MSHSSGDFDGDGRPDDLAVYAVPASDRRVPFRIRVTFGDRVVEHELEVTAPEAGSLELENPAAAAVGGFDAALTGRDLAFVQVEHGASTAFVGLFALTGCRLVPVTVDGVPLRLASGGSAGHFDYFGCSPDAAGGPRIITVSWEANDAGGDSFRLVRTVYELSGTTARQVSQEASTVPARAPGEPPDLPEAEALRCGSLRRP